MVHLSWLRAIEPWIIHKLMTYHVCNISQWCILKTLNHTLMHLSTFLSGHIFTFRFSCLITNFWSCNFTQTKEKSDNLQLATRQNDNKMHHCCKVVWKLIKPSICTTWGQGNFFSLKSFLTLIIGKLDSRIIGWTCSSLLYYIMCLSDLPKLLRELKKIGHIFWKYSFLKIKKFKTFH